MWTHISVSLIMSLRNRESVQHFPSVMDVIEIPLSITSISIISFSWPKELVLFHWHKVCTYHPALFIVK